MTLIITLALLSIMFWIGYHVTGALLSAAIWICIRLPLAVAMFGLGIACCVTILLIPLGRVCFRAAGALLLG